MKITRNSDEMHAHSDLRCWVTCLNYTTFCTKFTHNYSKTILYVSDRMNEDNNKYNR